MNPWMAVPVTAVLLTIGAWASYSTFNKSPWYLVMMCGLGLCGALTWGLSCRWAGDDARTIYSISMACDALTILVYSLVPLLAFGVRLSPTAWFGLMFVILGTLMVKQC
jgi:uncharacterized membrane protein